jgi:hypothetical protein
MNALFRAGWLGLALWLGLAVSAAQFASEYELLRRLPPESFPHRTDTTRPDAQGFVGNHARNGKWFEAGMQRSGCWQLIGAVVAGDQARADAAWTSIETTFRHQVADGGFVSNPRPDATHPPTYDARVETAFFYLQELGHALLVIRASPMAGHFEERMKRLEPSMRRACAFIQAGQDGILKKSGHTANRVFIAAKAFGLCGVYLNDEALKATSRKFMAAALERRDADGVFVERGGRDTSYNAVSLLMAQVLTLHLPEPKVEAAMVAAMAWQLTRIRPSGEVEVVGNTRTGVGLENGKTVNYREVAMALSYYGMIHDDPAAIALAAKVDRWPTRANP